MAVRVKAGQIIYRRETLPPLAEIASVGIELEGGYCFDCVSPIISHYGDKLHIEEGSDGSVGVDFTCSKHPDSEFESEGEIRAWVESKNLHLLFGFVKRMFQSGGFRQNSTCGNHVHVRFKNASKYDRFREKATWEEFERGYKSAFKMMKYLDRLSNEYCSSKWEPPYSNGYDHDSRYKMINLQSLREDQATLEFRILPHFGDSAEACDSYTKLLEIVNRIAEAREPRRSRSNVVEEYTDPPDDEYEVDQW